MKKNLNNNNEQTANNIITINNSKKKNKKKNNTNSNKNETNKEVHTSRMLNATYCSINHLELLPLWLAGVVIHTRLIPK